MAEPRPVRYPPGSPDDLAEQEAARQWADEDARRAGLEWHGRTWGKDWPINSAARGPFTRTSRSQDAETDDEAVS